MNSKTSRSVELKDCVVLLDRISFEEMQTMVKCRRSKRLLDQNKASETAMLGNSKVAKTPKKNARLAKTLRKNISKSAQKPLKPAMKAGGPTGGISTRRKSVAFDLDMVSPVSPVKMVRRKLFVGSNDFNRGGVNHQDSSNPLVKQDARFSQKIPLDLSVSFYLSFFTLNRKMLLLVDLTSIFPTGRS